MLTVDVQQWLRRQNGKAVKVKITDLKIDKTKERGQIRQMDHDKVAKKMVGYQALQPPGPLRVMAWGDSCMTGFTFDRRHFLCVLWSKWDRNVHNDSGIAARRRQRTG